MVGVMDFPGFRRATVADIPGLIEGAHRDVGLGHDFLRHIVRCRTLLLVVDAAGSEGRDPVEDAKKIREELRLYDPLLARRPWAIVANKIDLPGAAENIPRLEQEFPGVPLIAISAQQKNGLESLRRFIDAEVGRPG
jgi:GTP-binding protein